MSEEKGSIDIEIVNFFERHLQQPCVAPNGRTVRQIYIDEAQRLLDLNKITDSVERERLKTILQVARLFKQAEDL